jgi:hypothetical protein
MMFQSFTGATLEQLALTASPLLVLLSLRVAPTLAYIVSTRELSLAKKCLAAGAFVPLLIATTIVFGPVLLYVALGLGYYCACVCALYAAIPAIRAGRITRPALFWLNSVAFLVLPAILLPPFVASTLLVYGFGVVFSTYSYCVENASTKGRPRLRECLFFVFVDPTLAFTERSRQSGPPRISALGLARMLWGIIGLLLATTVLAILWMELRPAGKLSAMGLDQLRVFAIFVVVRFLYTYVQQSALASFQIGLMRQLGYTTPESFRYPLLATSPIDFWRRWNAFLGNWIRRYVYGPLTLRLGRALGRTRPDWAKAAGIVATFGVVGFWHAGYAYVASFQVGAGWITLFVFHGLFIVGWVVASRVMTLLGVGIRATGLGHVLGSIGGRVCLLAVLSFSTAYWGAG